MRLEVRVLATLLLLAGVLAGQAALRVYLAPVQKAPATPLRRPLAELPLRLGDWTGAELPEDQPTRYADQHVRRAYRHAERNQRLTVWVAYSGVGADRVHHPEVCLAVAGQQEDRSVRQALSVPGPGGPIQQYKFRGLAGAQWVFYWHYTLPADQDDELHDLQRLYQRLQGRASSVTLEVFAPSRSDRDEAAAREFVGLLDAAIRQHVGPTATRGSQRLPVLVVEGQSPANPEK